MGQLKEYTKAQAEKSIDMLKPKNNKHIWLMCLNLLIMCLSIIGIYSNWMGTKFIASLYVVICGIAVFAGIGGLE